MAFFHDLFSTTFIETTRSSVFETRMVFKSLFTFNVTLALLERDGRNG